MGPARFNPLADVRAPAGLVDVIDTDFNVTMLNPLVLGPNSIYQCQQW